MLELIYDFGTVIIRPENPDEKKESIFNILGAASEFFIWDTRSLCARAEAHKYREIITLFRAGKITYKDSVRNYAMLDTKPVEVLPRKHQAEALKAWSSSGSRAVVCLPTGAGKTILAVLAIAQLNRPTLVVVPTLDLMRQWEKILQTYFHQKIGMIGGGEHSILPLTISTYDSAAIKYSLFGQKFGFVVFDECHHLPAQQYQLIAKSMIAPFRLGLSATLERADGGEEIAYDLIGPLCYEGRIDEMQEKVLAPYKIVSLEVPMTDHELLAYQTARKTYTNYIKQQQIQLSEPDGWMTFVKVSSRTPEGRAAMKAYRDQKKLSQASSAKMAEIWKIMQTHEDERILIFTDDNETAYKIGQKYFLPVLTHHTKLRERKNMIESFKKGELKILVTSKVLNEGVDVPEASIGIVVSGSSTVREHVQRLGRILRHQDQKTAILYEIISKNTSEFYVNQRRKQHYAYQGASEISYSSR